GVRSGVLVYRSGNVPVAAHMFATIASQASGDDRERARYWQGRLLVESGNGSGKQVLQQLRSDDPTNFYSLRAEVLLHENDAKARSTPSLKESSTDWKKISSYIERQTGNDPDAT